VIPGCTPLVGVTVEIVGVARVKGTVLDQAEACCTWAVPDRELDATVAWICVLLQLTTEANVVPSQTAPVPCVEPNPEPEIVYWPT